MLKTAHHAAKFTTPKRILQILDGFCDLRSDQLKGVFVGCYFFHPLPLNSFVIHENHEVAIGL